MSRVETLSRLHRSRSGAAARRAWRHRHFVGAPIGSRSGSVASSGKLAARMMFAFTLSPPSSSAAWAGTGAAILGGVDRQQCRRRHRWQSGKDIRGGPQGADRDVGLSQQLFARRRQCSGCLSGAPEAARLHGCQAVEPADPAVRFAGWSRSVRAMADDGGSRRYQPATTASGAARRRRPKPSMDAPA